MRETVAVIAGHPLVVEKIQRRLGPLISEAPLNSFDSAYLQIEMEEMCFCLTFLALLTHISTQARECPPSSD